MVKKQAEFPVPKIFQLTFIVSIKGRKTRGAQKNGWKDLGVYKEGFIGSHSNLLQRALGFRHQFVDFLNHGVILAQLNKVL